MTKFLLEKILKLFAITAYNGISIKYTDTLDCFLSDNVSEEYRNSYRKMFEELLETHESASSSKKLSLNSVRLIKYCSELVENTDLNERLIIIINLLNFIKTTRIFSYEQKEFLSLITDIFEIETNDLNNLIHFSENQHNKIDSDKLSYYYHNNNKVIVLLKNSTKLILLKSVENNVFVNSRECKSDYIYIIDYQSTVKVENLRQLNYRDLLLLFNQDEDKQDFELYADNINVKIKNQIILHNTSFVAQSGEMIGIIGKSGSGKSTLLKSLAGIYNFENGNIFLKTADDKSKIVESSFVNQDNSFIGGFTVEEHLTDRAKYLQMPCGEYSEKINKILNHVELFPHKNKIALDVNNKHSELSGGQQKRLNIAMALLQNPDVILMDEPSSGLSSNEAVKIFNLLKSISLQNKIVISSVHQPDISIFGMFDKILIINEGYTVFYGSPAETAEYFRNTAERIDNESVFGENYNPGIIIDILDEKTNKEGAGKISPEIWYQKYKLINQANKKSSVISPANNDGQKKQSVLLSVKDFLFREYKILQKSPWKASLFIIIPAILALLLSFISRYSDSVNYSYYSNPNIPAWILMILVSALFTGLISTGHEFILLRNFRQNENLAYNKNGSYISAKLIKVFLLTIIQALILSYISIFIIGINGHGFKFFLIVWSVCLFGAVLGLVLSKLLNTLSMVYLLAPLVIIPQILFAGALIEYKNFHNLLRNDKYVPLIADIIPLRWAGEAIMVDFYKNNNFEKHIFESNVILNESVYYSDYFIPEIESIYQTDSHKAEKILQNEMNKNKSFQISDKSFYENLKDIKKYYKNIKTNVLNVRDSIYKNIDNHGVLQQKYSNRALSNLLQKNYDFNNYIVKNNEIIRKFMPIYILPDNNFRNHFFTPYKRFFGNLVDTYYYNLIVLLIFTGILIILLWLLRLKR